MKGINRAFTQSDLTLQKRVIEWIFMNKYKLTLYVTGKSSKSKKAIKNLNNLCKKVASDTYTLEIVDTLENPERAENARVIATPTLVKELSLPAKRIAGNLSNEKKLLISLDLPPVPEPDTKEVKQ